MLKPLVVAAAALAIAGSSIVYAQHLGGPDRDDSRFAQHHRLSPEDRAAFVDARIAALKAGLELTPDQAKNWPDFEKSLRDMAQVRAERIAAREAAAQNPDKARAAPFDRLAQRADGMAKASACIPAWMMRRRLGSKSWPGFCVRIIIGSTRTARATTIGAKATATMVPRGGIRGSSVRTTMECLVSGA
jgi:hypothetical protein